MRQTITRRQQDRDSCHAPWFLNVVFIDKLPTYSDSLNEICNIDSSYYLDTRVNLGQG